MKNLKEEIVSKDKKLNDSDIDVVVDLRNIGKKYIVHHEKPTLVEDVSRRLRFKENEEYWALKGVNLQIIKGERVGLYGPNGAGKTTLLKIIAGIAAPTEGTVSLKGKIISLIDVEAGFHPDLSGQENIFLSGLLVGMSKNEVYRKFSEIVNTSGLGSFITAPLFTYSSGMKIKLGFSIAVSANPDVLLLDEVMNMGDESFRKKSWNMINKMQKKGVSIVLVSQWINYLKEHCDKILELKKSNYE